MSDEEKKAIEVIKGLAVYYDDYSLLDEEEIEENEEVNNSINIVINLIEKQQKEIEELKIQNNKLAQCHFKYEEMTGVDLLLPDKLEYTSNDKIKAKIEELEKEKNIPEEMDFKAFYRIKDLKNIEIVVLQSLLKESEI